MQEDPLTRLDLTSEPSHADPSPVAKVARFSSHASRAELELDLSDKTPTERAVLGVHSTRSERSGLAFHVYLWPPRVKLLFHVEGHLSWAAPFGAVVLLLAIVAAIIIPTVILAPGTARETSFAVAGISGGFVLVAGMVALLLLLYKRR